MVLKYNGRNYGTNPIPIDREKYITSALQYFVLEVMEKRLTKKRLEDFLDKYSVKGDDSIRQEIARKTRTLLRLQDMPFPLR